MCLRTEGWWFRRDSVYGLMGLRVHGGPSHGHPIMLQLLQGCYGITAGGRGGSWGVPGGCTELISYNIIPA